MGVEITRVRRSPPDPLGSHYRLDSTAVQLSLAVVKFGCDIRHFTPL